jgi:TPP-dependent pyruvate/acetoin dehydrogenase alpha subunit
VSSRTKTAGSGLARTDLSEERAKELYRRLYTSRLIDERGRKLFRQGRMLGNMYTAAGQEAITLVPAFLLKELDFIGPSHRELPASVGKGVPLKAIFAQILARAVSPDKGKSHPCHYGYAPLRVLTPASTVAAQYVVATGVALAYKMQKNGLVAIAYTGDGGTARGDFHEALNFAAVHKVPAVYFIQNNLWAESVPLSLQTALTDLSDRAKGVRHAGHHDRRQRRARGLRDRVEGDRARPQRRGPDPDRGQDLSLVRPLGDRPGQLSQRRGGRRVEGEGSAAALREDPRRGGRAQVRRGREIQAQIAKDIEEALTWAEAQPYATPETAYTDVFAPGTFGGYA